MTKTVELTLEECNIILENLAGTFRCECDDLTNRYGPGDIFEFDNIRFEQIVELITLIRKIQDARSNLIQVQNLTESTSKYPC